MNKCILLLGANSDIARAIAHRYAKAGYDVQLAARKKNRLEADASDLEIKYGVKTRIYEFDAIKWDTHEAFYDQLDPKPEVVCCVFGLMPDQQAAEKDWNTVLETISVNYTGAVSILEIAARDMESRQSGTIIGISSVAGERGRGSNYFYGSAKAGFTAYLSGLRNRLQTKGVHVLTVKPGFVNTAMTANLDLPPLLTASPQKVAADVFKAASSQKNVRYTKWMWKYIMLIIRNIPEFIFKKLSL